MLLHWKQSNQKHTKKQQQENNNKATTAARGNMNRVVKKPVFCICENKDT